MSHALSRAGRLLLAGALVLAIGPPALAAQSDLDASEAGAFMGRWTVPLDTDMGYLEIAMTVEDRGGKVAVIVGSAELGGDLEVTDVTRDGESLLLGYDVDVDGQYVDVLMRFTPEGDGLAYTLDAMGGTFYTSGTATRAGG